MKNQLVLNNLPTYVNGTTIDLNRVNLFFGKNGCGKSTLCNYLKENPDILIENQEELIVFNKEYKKHQIIDGMKGIYTFGDVDSNIIQEIALKREKIKERMENKEKELDKAEKTKKQIDESQKTFAEEVWNNRKDIVDKYPGAELFKGYNNNKTKFAEQLLSIYKEYSKKQYTDSEIEYCYDLIKDNCEKKYCLHQQLEQIDCSSIAGFQLLSKSIVSYSDNDLNKYYSKLNNTDWVRNGRPYLTEDCLCPFCKTKLTEQFYTEFKAVFDEVYDEEILELTSFIDSYSTYLDNVVRQIRSILSNKCKRIDYTQLEKRVEIIRQSIENDQKNMGIKKDSPSITIILNDISEDIAHINRCISDINERIEQYNKDIDEREKMSKRMTELSWIKISTELCRRCDGFEKCNRNLSKQYNTHIQVASTITKEIEELENSIKEQNNQISNIESTILCINNLLSNFGFNTFKLDINDKIPGTYCIKRSDKIGNVDTLSEGEFNLIAFLYLYHLIYGSLNVNDDGNPIAVAIDDPVSSMDGDTVSIISALTKKIIEDCVEEKSRVKKLLIFTHNIYYYKEIEYKSKNDKNKIDYHIIVKTGQNSIIDTSSTSKIYSTYEQLWKEYCQSSSPITTLNCMRRILEYYFRSLIGTNNYNEVCSEFNDSERISFDILTNMLNSGSHSIFDPIYTMVDESTIEKYKIVFRKVFEKSGNTAHYKHMTGRVET